MKELKPKDVAKQLGIRPSLVTILAKDIENADLYKFSKTPIGSFLFHEKELPLLKEYYQTVYFFKKKTVAMEMLRYRMDLLPEEDRTPEWVKYLENAVFVN